MVQGKFHILLALLLWLSPLVEGAGEVSAQIKFGVKGGVNLVSFSNNKEFLDAKYRSGFFVGPTLKADVATLPLGVDISLIYDQRSASVTNYLPNDAAFPGNSLNEKIRSRTLNIPLNLRFYVLDIGGLDAFVKAGPQVSTYLGDKKVVEGITDYKEEWDEADYSVNLGAGFTISEKLEVSANCNIYCGKRKNASWSDAFEHTTQSVKHDMKKLAWQVGVAWYF